MKLFRIAIAAVFALGAGSAYAFHSGGVAECGGCHSMHTPAAPQGGGESYLLIGVTPSSTCLDCHAYNEATGSRYHVMTYNTVTGTNVSLPVELTPGGDFAWLGITTTATPRAGTVNTYLGQTRGHNVYAPDFGILTDTDYAFAPGSNGGFASANLGCNSCHDPHGKLRRLATGNTGTTGDNSYTWARTGAPIAGSGSYNNSAVPTTTTAVGAYRILRGRGADADVGAGLPYVPSTGFNGNFLAVAPNTYNRSEATNPTRVAYGVDGTQGGTGTAVDTVGQWCGSCHADMHSLTTTQPLVHPVDQALPTAYITNYGNYVSSGIMTGTPATSYLELVPFATKTGDFGALKTLAQFDGSNGSLGGPAAGDQVMCLSCHRSHASGFSYMLRWNYETGEFLTESVGGVVQWKSGNGGTGLTLEQVNNAYYQVPATKFGNYQRQLCNKCHAKD